MIEQTELVRATSETESLSLGWNQVAEDCNVIGIQVDGTFVASMSFCDVLHPGDGEPFKYLQFLGLGTVMLTGGRQSTVEESIACESGISELIWGFFMKKKFESCMNTVPRMESGAMKKVHPWTVRGVPLK